MKIAKISVYLIITVLMSIRVQAGMIKQIEINSEPEKKGMRDFTVRIRPEETHKCDVIIVKCFYLQQFPWENLQGEKYIKKYEPVAFTYRAETTGLTAGLDKYISFRIPMSLKILQKTYGDKLFNADYPVSISRFKISGLRNDNVIWNYELKGAGGVFNLDK